MAYGLNISVLNVGCSVKFGLLYNAFLMHWLFSPELFLSPDMLEFELSFIDSTRYLRLSRKDGECLVRKRDILFISGLEYAYFFSASSCYLTFTW